MSPAEQEGIQAGLRSSDAFTLRRSQILLASSREQRPKEIARHLSCATQTVRNAIHAFEQKGLACLKQESSQRQREDAQLSSHIRQIFVSHQEVYGSPRIHAELADQGYRYSRKRIARLMRENGITASRKRRRVVTTNSRHENPVAPNLLQRDFTAQAPNRKWATDVRHVGAYEIPAHAGEGESSAPLGHGLT